MVEDRSRKSENDAMLSPNVYSPNPNIQHPSSNTHPLPSLLNRRALITGASRGLGAAIAERFAQEGAHVILVARDTQGLETVDDRIQALGGASTLVPLDLRQGDAIDSLAAQVYERFSGLDILVGNAGILGSLSPVPHISPAHWKTIMAVNLTANWRLIRAFDPLLRQSAAGRAIFVSSSSATDIVPYWSAYAASKAALEMLVKTYAEEVRNTYPSLKVNLVDPGHLRTTMGAEAMPGEDPSTLPHPSTVTDLFVRLASEACEEHGGLVRSKPYLPAI